MAIVTLCDILEYVEGGSRCIKEGEAVFNAGHIIMCGINNEKEEEILGLCVQTSNLKGHPHKIKINLDTPKQWMCTCTCKAGAGGKCKHIIACLLFIYRNNLEHLSCTDLEQAWGQRKHNVSCEDVVPIKEFCHVKKRKVPNAIDQEILKLTYEELLCGKKSAHLRTLGSTTEGAPNSEAAVHQRMRCKPVVVQPTNEPNPNEAIITNALKLNFCFELPWALPVLPLLNIKQQEYFNNYVAVTIEEAINISVQTIGQSNDQWKRARKCRITASTCYELYTYCSNKTPNWGKKISSYMTPSFKGNKYTNHGIKYEPAARNRYETQYGKVFETGVIINSLMPWLACSPDGLKMHQDYFYRLIEIKCPFLGSNRNISEIAESLPYVKYDHTKAFPYFLNKKHKYYSQVQLNMAVLNLEYCDFVLYSSHDSSILVIEVKRDDEFLKLLINKLHFVYFNLLLPKLANSE